jgi:hypothetical protein
VYQMWHSQQVDRVFRLFILLRQTSRECVLERPKHTAEMIDGRGVGVSQTTIDWLWSVQANRATHSGRHFYSIPERLSKCSIPILVPRSFAWFMPYRYTVTVSPLPTYPVKKCEEVRS